MPTGARCPQRLLLQSSRAPLLARCGSAPIRGRPGGTSDPARVKHSFRAFASIAPSRDSGQAHTSNLSHRGGLCITCRIPLTLTLSHVGERGFLGNHSRGCAEVSIEEEGISWCSLAVVQRSPSRERRGCYPNHWIVQRALSLGEHSPNPPAASERPLQNAPTQDSSAFHVAEADYR